MYFNENYFWGKKNEDVTSEGQRGKLLTDGMLSHCSTEVKTNTKQVVQSTNWISMPKEKTGRVYLLIKITEV